MPSGTFGGYFVGNEEVEAKFSCHSENGAGGNCEHVKVEEKEEWPKEAEIYYYFNSILEIHPTVNSENSDKSRINLGNCFRTEAEAKVASDKIRELLLSLK
jgi:hypothetical protein